ncbi:chromate efflux transporter [Segnochrobactraceae bacterium EtOH-i3]
MAGTGAAAEVGRAFLGLGLTSFGGPTAHIGYFRAAFVARRGWLTDRDFAGLTALCQLLPGPASSQLGMAIGLKQAGFAGLAAAWAGFTLPSALLMTAFAAGLGPLVARAGPGLLLGFTAAAVAVVALAARSMAATLAASRATAVIAALALAASLFPLGVFGPVLVILGGGLAGLLALPAPALPEDDAPAASGVPAPVALACAVLLVGLLIGLPILADVSGHLLVRLADIFVRAGALVFGGGHVVLPLLESGLVGPGLIGHDTFLAGYGLAQTVPGPLFTLASYLGFVIAGPAGALVATLSVFVPSALVLIAALPVRDRLARLPRFAAVLSGVDAAVVGLVAAVPLRTLASGTLANPVALAILALSALALGRFRLPAWGVVPLAGLAGALLA